MTRSKCCDDQEWKGVADFDHTAGLDFDLGQCANCEAYLLSVAYADWPTVHVIEAAAAEELLRLGDTPARKRALKNWVEED